MDFAAPPFLQNPHGTPKCSTQTNQKRRRPRSLHLQAYAMATTPTSTTSAGTQAPTPSSLTLPHQQQQPHSQAEELFDSTLSKETLGLPIFISSSSRTILSSSDEVYPAEFSPLSNLPSPLSLELPKRVSQVLDFAFTSWERICEGANMLVSEEAGQNTGANDLESGTLRRHDNGVFSRDGSAKDGWTDVRSRVSRRGSRHE